MIITITVQLDEPKATALDDLHTATQEREQLVLHTAADVHLLTILGMHTVETL